MTPLPFPRHQIDVQIDEPLQGDIDAARLRRAAELALEVESQTEPVEVSVVITDDEAIQRLNRQFRGIDEPTDVLAFGSSESESPFVSAPEAGTYLGDVIISLPRAVAQAAEQGHGVGQELALLVVHGMLHLLGHDHASADQKQAMWARQEAILSRLA